MLPMCKLYKKIVFGFLGKGQLTSQTGENAGVTRSLHVEKLLIKEVTIVGTLAKDEEVVLTKCLRKHMQVQNNMFNDTYTVTCTRHFK